MNIIESQNKTWNKEEIENFTKKLPGSWRFYTNPVLKNMKNVLFLENKPQGVKEEVDYKRLIFLGVGTIDGSDEDTKFPIRTKNITEQQKVALEYMKKHPYATLKKKQGGIIEKLNNKITFKQLFEK